MRRLSKSVRSGLPLNIRNQWKSLRLTFFGLLWLWGAFPGAANAAPPGLPFQVGEVLEYDLKWSVFGVGRARMEVLPMTEVEGATAWHFAFSVRTNAFADRFFKVRTTINSWVSEDLQRTLRYTEIKREGKTERAIELNFDYESNRVTYFNFGEAREPVELPDGPVLDPLGAVYHLRALLPGAGKDASGSMDFSVTDGKKVVALRIQPEREERIRVNGRRYESLRFIPQTGELGGVFEKSEDSEVRIWFTADASAALLQVQGEVVVGSFWAKLVAAPVAND